MHERHNKEQQMWTRNKCKAISTKEQKTPIQKRRNVQEDHKKHCHANILEAHWRKCVGRNAYRKRRSI